MKNEPLENNRRILIIDDSQSIQADFRKILAASDSDDTELINARAELFGGAIATPGKRHFELTAALQGQEGLAVVQAAKQSGRPFAMAFVDIRMPPGWDGIETTARLWETDPDLQVVLCTAYSDYSWKNITARIGNSDQLVILKKPFDTVEVLQLANALTEKWRLILETRRRMDQLEEQVGERTRHLKEANESLQAEVAHRERHEHCLALQYEVTRVLADSTATSEDVITRILQIVCQSMNWDTGRLWTVDRLAKVLRCTAIWNSAKAELANSKPPAALAAGNGLPGRVWESGQAAWISDLTREGNASGSSPAVNPESRAAFAFPLQLRGEILGVAEFHSEQIRPPESDLLQIFATLGNLIGQSLERKKLEEQLLQSQKMDAIGRLAGGVAHDFNNILTVIQGYAQILATREDFDQKALDDLKQILQSAHRASNLTRQLLTFSRKQIIKTVVLDLNKVTSNLTKMLQRIIGEDVLLQCNFSPETPLIRADEDMIGQILMNLAVNARDAMPKGGELAISLSVVELDSTAAQWRSSEAQAGEFVCLSVNDTGCGIAPEDLLRIFEPFFTTKAVGQGTGLGLSTVYGIVKQHGGWIEVSSKLNIGTKFNIFLPRAAAGAAAETGGVEPKIVGGTETILLVEDEPPVRTLARVILQRHGYHVLEATSGADALSVWGQHAAKIDLLLTDIIMPQGVSGRELAQKLRADRPGLKVVFVSGYSPDSMEIGAELNEGTFFLQKPYLPEHLLRSIRQALDGQAKQPDSRPD